MAYIYKHTYPQKCVIIYASHTISCSCINSLTLTVASRLRYLSYDHFCSFKRPETEGLSKLLKAIQLVMRALGFRNGPLTQAYSVKHSS